MSRIRLPPRPPETPSSRQASDRGARIPAADGNRHTSCGFGHPKAESVIAPAEIAGDDASQERFDVQGRWRRPNLPIDREFARLCEDLVRREHCSTREHVGTSVHRSRWRLEANRAPLSLTKRSTARVVSAAARAARRRASHRNIMRPHHRSDCLGRYREHAVRQRTLVARGERKDGDD